MDAGLPVASLPLARTLLVIPPRLTYRDADTDDKEIEKQSIYFDWLQESLVSTNSLFYRLVEQEPEWNSPPGWEVELFIIL